ARTYFQYAQLLLEDLLSGKKQLTFNHLREIFWQVLKALYALTETKAPEKTPTPEELINKIFSTLNERERQKILFLKEIFFTEKTPDTDPKELRTLLEEIKDIVGWLKGVLNL
ncbi:MAG: hypothetical protein ACK4UR_00180, partial [Caldimicrobium sp.]